MHNIITVRPCQEKDLESAIKIYKNTFEDAGFSSEINIDESLKKSQVAISQEQIVGVCTYRNVFESKYVKTNIESAVYYSTHPEQRDFLLSHYSNNATQIGKGKPVVDYFKNDLVGNISVLDNDGNIGGIALKNNYQGKGLGKLLLQSTEAILKESGSEKVFLDCWDRYSNMAFYENQGYSPIIRLGPTYHDGSPLVVMCKRIDL